jgi:membrane protease YdiL (CAAX protease family)
MKTGLRALVVRHPLLSFFGLAYALMYGVGFASVALLKGHPMDPYSISWFLCIFSPTISALAVSGIIGGLPEVKRLLSGFARWRVGVWWYLAALGLFLGPLAIAGVYRLLGNATPGMTPGLTGTAFAGSLLFTLLSGPVAEEAGWRGFALPRLQERFGALTSSLILGVVWAFWHIPLYFMTGASRLGVPFFIYLPLVVTLTIFLTWLYDNTGGSLIITVLAHYAFNLDAVLITGSLGLLPLMVFYMTAGPGLLIGVVVVVVVFGSRNLSRKPVGELPFRRAHA